MLWLCGVSCPDRSQTHRRSCLRGIRDIVIFVSEECEGEDRTMASNSRSQSRASLSALSVDELFLRLEKDVSGVRSLTTKIEQVLDEGDRTLGMSREELCDHVRLHRTLLANLREQRNSLSDVERVMSKRQASCLRKQPKARLVKRHPELALPGNESELNLLRKGLPPANDMLDTCDKLREFLDMSINDVCEKRVVELGLHAPSVWLEKEGEVELCNRPGFEGIEEVSSEGGAVRRGGRVFTKGTQVVPMRLALVNSNKKSGDAVEKTTDQDIAELADTVGDTVAEDELADRRGEVSTVDMGIQTVKFDCGHQRLCVDCGRILAPGSSGCAGRPPVICKSGCHIRFCLPANSHKESTPARAPSIDNGSLHHHGPTHSHGPSHDHGSSQEHKSSTDDNGSRDQPSLTQQGELNEPISSSDASFPPDINSSNKNEEQPMVNGSSEVRELSEAPKPESDRSSSRSSSPTPSGDTAGDDTARNDPHGELSASMSDVSSSQLLQKDNGAGQSRDGEMMHATDDIHPTDKVKGDCDSVRQESSPESHNRDQVQGSTLVVNDECHDDEDASTSPRQQGHEQDRISRPDTGESIKDTSNPETSRTGDSVINPPHVCGKNNDFGTTMSVIDKEADTMLVEDYTTAKKLSAALEAKRVTCDDSGDHSQHTSVECGEEVTGKADEVTTPTLPEVATTDRSTTACSTATKDTTSGDVATGTNMLTTACTPTATGASTDQPDLSTTTQPEQMATLSKTAGALTTGCSTLSTAVGAATTALATTGLSTTDCTSTTTGKLTTGRASEAACHLALADTSTRAGTLKTSDRSTTAGSSTTTSPSGRADTLATDGPPQMASASTTAVPSTLACALASDTGSPSTTADPSTAASSEALSTADMPATDTRTAIDSLPSLVGHPLDEESAEPCTSPTNESSSTPMNRTSFEGPLDGSQPTAASDELHQMTSQAERQQPVSSDVPQQTAPPSEMLQAAPVMGENAEETPSPIQDCFQDSKHASSSPTKDAAPPSETSQAAPALDEKAGETPSPIQDCSQDSGHAPSSPAKDAACSADVTSTVKDSLSMPREMVLPFPASHVVEQRRSAALIPRANMLKALEQVSKGVPFNCPEEAAAFIKTSLENIAQHYAHPVTITDIMRDADFLRSMQGSVIPEPSISAVYHDDQLVIPESPDDYANMEVGNKILRARVMRRKCVVRLDTQKFLSSFLCKPSEIEKAAETGETEAKTPAL